MLVLPGIGLVSTPDFVQSWLTLPSTDGFSGLDNSNLLTASATGFGMTLDSCWCSTLIENDTLDGSLLLSLISMPLDCK